MSKIIVNKFAGTCNICQTRVGAGEGIATKKGGRWEVTCKKDAGETHGAHNPWRDIHEQGEMDYTGGEYTRRIARQLVANEYRDTDRMAEPCECGGTCHWRATVGARICPSCGTMIVYRWNKATETMERVVVPGK